jgi:hypothetical protein
MFTELQSCTRFSAHNEMCEIIESLEDSTIDFSFRGRDNYFLLEHVGADEKITRYIMYVFLICTEQKGWMMKMLSETDKIPNTNCPVRLLKQSTSKEPSALAWREMIMQMEELRTLERMSIKAEATATCVCRHKDKASPLDGQTPSIVTSESAHH